MNGKKWWLFLWIGLLVAGLALVGLGVQAQSGGGFSLTWWSVDGGGGSSSGSSYALLGTAGQPDAGTMNGGDYVILGGFWQGGATAVTEQAIYLPVIIRAP